MSWKDLQVSYTIDLSPVLGGACFPTCSFTYNCKSDLPPVSGEVTGYFPC